MLPVSPSPSSKTVVCTSLGSSWVCLCSWKSEQTDLGSDSSTLYNDSDPSLFIKSCWPLRLHTPLPLLTDPHCIQAPSTALWNQTRKWPQRGIQKGVWVSVCTKYYAQKYILTQLAEILLTFILRHICMINNKEKSGKFQCWLTLWKLTDCSI